MSYKKSKKSPTKSYNVIHFDLKNLVDTLVNSFEISAGTTQQKVNSY